MKKILKTSFLFLVMLSAAAQEPIVTGQSHSFHSTVLGEERIIDVQLPKHYDNPDFAKADYPVLYVLDGDFNFPFVSALERFNTKFLYRPHPEMIVIGIRNTDRTRDFTPTKTGTSGPDGKNHFETSGGADRFIDFLREELQPYINSNFRSNGYDILLGHSFGGLFTIYTLLEAPELFDDYIAIDPSLWWDDQVIYKRAKARWETTDFQKKGLFVALAYEAPENTKDRFEHGKLIRRFCENTLNAYPQNNLRTQWKYYPDHDHGAVPVPAAMDALYFLFDGIQLPVKKIPENPELVSRTYAQVSKKLNFDLRPDESLLYELIRYVRGTGNEDSADTILDHALDIYPDSKQLQRLKNDH